MQSKLGVKVRSLRRQERLTQAQLAERLGISASYLALIENNRRPLTAPLLIKLARLFEVDFEAFDAGDDERLASDLVEVFADPRFDELGLTTTDVRELVAQVPAAGQAVLQLYQSLREAQVRLEGLAASVSADGEAGGRVLALPSEEVSEVIQRHRNHFPALEAGAVALRQQVAAEGDDLGGGLVRYLARAHQVEVRVETVEKMGGAVRRFDPPNGRLALSELLAPRSRTFQLAHVLGLIEQRDVIEAIVAEAGLTTETARALCRVALANYFSGAVVMPYAAFLAAAKAVRYDVELLGHRFRASFEQVCHRLTTMRRSGDSGVPFHFMRIDIAGNISKRFSASGIHFARFSGACPRWNVHAAFMTPGRIRTQISEMPDGTSYFCIARTVQHGGAGYHASHSIHAIGLGCKLEHASRLVYGDGVKLDGAPVEVGVTCRLCSRMDCEQRAMPPLQQPLDVDENVRGLSFYATTMD